MKPIKALWSDRALFKVPVTWAIATTPKIFNDALAEIYDPEPPPIISPQKHDRAGATTHHFIHSSGIECCLVYLPYDPKHTPIEHVGLIVHESMHVWRALRESLGENEPSTEFEAYTMQHITQDLLVEFKRQVYGE